jgi:hypothetical protein
MQERKTQALFNSSFRRNKMKNNLRMLGLALCMLPLCMLPVCMHAGTEQDLKPTYQPAQEQNTRSAEAIPAGTIIPVTLNSGLRSDKAGSGAVVTATVMQDVPLGGGETLRRGSKIMGHVVDAITSGKGSDEARISFQFGQVRLGNQTVPITVNLRAVASPHAVLQASPQPSSSETTDYEVEIGGDEISYAEGGAVMVGSRVVGKYTSHGVLANVDQDLGTPCGATIDSNAQPQAFWLFSVNACGAYGFGDLKILQSEHSEPVGEVTLASNRKMVKVDKGSAMLLRVVGNEPEEAHAHTTPSRAIGQ